jgi:hypothetical protein
LIANHAESASDDVTLNSPTTDDPVTFVIE